jgi:hypothetical protein
VVTTVPGPTRSAPADQRVPYARAKRSHEGAVEAPESATADLNEALEREIRDHESTLLADPSQAAR